MINARDRLVEGLYRSDDDVIYRVRLTETKALAGGFIPSIVDDVLLPRLPYRFSMRYVLLLNTESRKLLRLPVHSYLDPLYVFGAPPEFTINDQDGWQTVERYREKP